jgi:hypothetical protein
MDGVGHLNLDKMETYFWNDILDDDQTTETNDKRGIPQIPGCN